MLNINRQVISLDEFTIRESKAFPESTGALSSLLRDIGLAAKRINVEVNKAGLVDILGDAGTVNVQGEEVKKLDVFANQQMIGALRHGVSCAGIASEELDDFLSFDDDISKEAKYVCLFDPLDGSDNIDVNIPIGTIFSIIKRVSPLGTSVNATDFLQPGTAQLAAGYIVYGSSTMMVIATRKGVNGFTLDPSIGEFCLSHPDMRCPANGQIYSVNNGNFLQFETGLQRYLNACQSNSHHSGIHFTHRYIGSLVADVHRNLLKGGLFIYPGTADHPEGKLRLLYECNPLAFIVTMAGGKATDGRTDILHINPLQLHQRIPLFIGSRNMVSDLNTYLLD